MSAHIRVPFIEGVDRGDRDPQKRGPHQGNTAREGATALTAAACGLWSFLHDERQASETQHPTIRTAVSPEIPWRMYHAPRRGRKRGFTVAPPRVRSRAMGPVPSNGAEITEQTTPREYGRPTGRYRGTKDSLAAMGVDERALIVRSESYRGGVRPRTDGPASIAHPGDLLTKTRSGRRVTGPARGGNAMHVALFEGITDPFAGPFPPSPYTPEQIAAIEACQLSSEANNVAHNIGALEASDLQRVADAACAELYRRDCVEDPDPRVIPLFDLREAA